MIKSKLKFAPVRSTPDPLNQQDNHVTSHSSREEETPSSAMFAMILSKMICFEMENGDKFGI